MMNLSRCLALLLRSSTRGFFVRIAGLRPGAWTGEKRMATSTSSRAGTARPGICSRGAATVLAGVLAALASALYGDPARATVTVDGDVDLGFNCFSRADTPPRYHDGGGGALFATGFTGFVHGTCGNMGNAESSADEARGEFKVNARANERTVAWASTTLSVQVTVSGPARATSVTDTFDMFVNGTTSPFLPQPLPFPNQPTSSWQACVTGNAPSLGGTVRSPGCTSGQNFGDGNAFASTETLTLTLPMHTVPGQNFSRSDPIFTVFSLQGYAFGQERPVDSVTFWGDIDMSHTALIRQTLPSGFTFTSDQGVFLTESPLNVTPVPEPGSAVLLGCGLAALSCLRRRWHAQALRPV